MAHLTVLVVEDEPIIRDLIVDFLSGEGFATIATGSGSEAVDIAAREQPDIILLDMMLPALDGAEVLRKLRANARTRSIRVIAMSADARLLREASALRVRDVLPKPFNLVDLLNLISARPVATGKGR